MTFQQAWAKTTLMLSGAVGSTRRFLDPPSEDNFTNKASGGGASARVERDFAERDRLSIYAHSKRTGFLVPNEAMQQEEGQRQDRRTAESVGMISYQRVLAPEWLFSARAMARDLAADLWSNSFSTPIYATNARGFREGYFCGSLSWIRGAHAAKFGGEFIATNLHESFLYSITKGDYFDGDFPETFQFHGTDTAGEAALYLQDTVRAGPVSATLGLRWDRYSLLVTENAVSPRLGMAYHIPKAGLRLYASYDRAFEPQAVEGILMALMAGSPTLQALTDETSGLPLRPARSHYFQLGFAWGLFGKLRLDANWYRRVTRNFGDDELLLNTGISFPLTFDRARIQGYEAKIELPRRGLISAWISYANMNGTGRLPLTGGLFLEEEAATQLQSADSFPITQDQRNTVRGRVRLQLGPRVWLATSLSYNSGLPFEREGQELDEGELAERFSSRILNKIDFDRGRVRPQLSL